MESLKKHVQSHEAAPTGEFLREDQNILDQEPFRTVFALTFAREAEYEKSIEKLQVKLYGVHSHNPATGEYAMQERRKKAEILKCFLINAAVKRQDIASTLQKVTGEERMNAFRWGGLFGPDGKASVKFTPLKSGLSDDVYIDIYTASGHGENSRLFSELMTAAADYPGWDEYIRQHRNRIFAYGERKRSSKPVEIPTFETWQQQQSR
ncbi:MAG: hypothetical protein Q8L52_01040 [bacterium]|nr:hypothetical protein [bacterium]